MIPVKAGMKIEEMARVENMAPNWVPVPRPAVKKYVAMVISHAPQTKNCKNKTKIKSWRREKLRKLFCKKFDQKSESLVSYPN